MADLRHTPLYDLHVAQAAKLVPYAGWEMPVQYPMGVMGEHQHTRTHAGLFDVSHMGQVIVTGDNVAAALETLIPADLVGLAEGRQRYGLLTSQTGGILDDLMVANKGDHFLLVVNASRADHDIAYLQNLDGVTVTHVTDRALVALQGPEAATVLARLIPAAAEMKFMDVRDLDWQGESLWLSRSGYTGEDGFEISVPAARAMEFTQALLDFPEVAMIGLGARDSLRLEAGLPLYGNDMDEETSPSRAALGWSIPKVRREGGERAGGYPGHAAIAAEMAAGAAKVRTGLRPQGRAPIREGVELFDAAEGGQLIGKVRSGGFGPSVGGPIAMAEVTAGLSEGTTIWAELRGKRLPVDVSALPFYKPNYKR